MEKKYYIEEINSWDGFINLESSWENLLKLQTKHSLFVSHPLMKLFYKVILDSFHNTQIKILIIKNEKKEIKGILPLTFEKQRIAGTISFHKLGIKDNIIGLYSFIFDPNENVPQMMKTLLRFLKKKQVRWDILSLHHIPSDMNSIDDFISFGYKQFHIKVNKTNTLFVSTPSDFSDILSYMKGKKRREMKRKIRRLSEDGDLELISITDQIRIQQYLPYFFDIENNNWKGKMGTSILKSPFKPFFENMALYLSQNQQFHLYLLKIKNTFVAGIYAIIENDTLYFVKIGYDEKYATYSPSLVLFYLVFERLCEQKKIQIIDFFGPIDSYQTMFGNMTRTTYDITFFNNNFIPIFYYLILTVFSKLQNHPLGKSIIHKINQVPFINNLIKDIYE